MDDNTLERLLRMRPSPVPDDDFAARIAARALAAREERGWFATPALAARALTGMSPGLVLAACVVAIAIGIVAGAQIGDFTDGSALDALSFDAVEDFLS